MAKLSLIAFATALTVAATTPNLSAQTLTVVTPSTHTDSKALRDLDNGNAPVHGVTSIRHHHGELPDELETPPLGPDQFDPVAQTLPGPLLAATADANFEGIGANGYVPSDNNIAVGPLHVVETVNVMYAVYNKSGGLITSGFLKSLWTGLGGACGANNGGDPTVQYDRFADRWIITQLGNLSAPYFQCIAVSKTGDPTGVYSLYSYAFNNTLNDYPKFGVWPTATNSAYLATYNLFYGASGAQLCAYDRTAMLAGAPNPIGICTQPNSLWPKYSYLPSDVDGSTPPLDGTPGYFINLASTSSLGVYKLKPDFTTPGNSTLSGPTTIPVSPFTEASDVPQPGAGTLDPLSDRLMYRLAFRVFADHEAMVTTHAVASAGAAGMRWYELVAPVSATANFTKFQEGTFTGGGDGNHRWMGSAAMDKAGDIGLGYSVSGPSTFPSVRYTGRVPSDALGAMQSEAVLINGSGSQTAYDRWGDYSSMQIDPTDDCTFWYVNEYYPITSGASWHTRIGSFKFNSCGTSPPQDFALSANPSSLSRAQGASAQSTVTVNGINNFTGNVTLSVLSGCPSNATCTLSPTTVPAGGTSTLSVTTTTSTPIGPYTITVQGNNSGIGNRTATFALTVTPAATGLTFTLSPTSITVKRKSFATTTVTLSGGNGTATLSVTGLPSKLSATFTPNPATSPGSATLRISANSNATPGTFPITVHGVSGSSSYSQPLTVIVTK